MTKARPDTTDTVELSRAEPVFVDPSGRRRKVLRRFVVGACVLVGLYVGVLTAALLGAPIPSSALLPAPAANQPAPPQSHPAAPPVDPVGAPTSTPKPPSDENTASQPAAAPVSAARVVATAPPAAMTSAPATTAPAGNRNSRAPSLPPGKDTTGRHP